MLAADLLIASDGPRLSAERPTIFLGARGTLDLGLGIGGLALGPLLAASQQSELIAMFR